MMHLIGAKLGALVLQAAAQANPPAMTPEQQIAFEAVKHGGGTTGVLGMLTPFAMFAMIFGVVWLGLKRKQAQMRTRAEFHKQLLDKFGSGHEFAEFLGSAGSQRFLDELWSQGPKEKILSSMRTGIVLAVLGLGMLGLSFAKHGFLIPAVLVLALGLGYLIATAVSYRLSRQWDHNRDADLNHPAAL